MIPYKRYISSTFAVTLVALPLLAYGQTEDLTASIALSEPLSVQDAIDITSDNKIKPVVLEHEFTVPGRKKSVGFIPIAKGAHADDILRKAKEDHLSFLLDVAADTESEEAPAFKKAAEKPSDIQIIRMTVQGKEDALTRLKTNDSRIKDINYSQERRKSEE